MSTEPTSRTNSANDLNLLAENLRNLMFKNNLDALTLSKETNIALSTINALKRGAGNPTLSTLLTLANYFGLTLSELAESTRQSNKQIIEIPLLELSEVSAYQLNKKYSDTFACEIENNEEDDSFAIQISNSALAPFFEKGTIFVVSRHKLPQDGDIVLVKFGESLPCFRKIFIEANHHYFKSISDMLNQTATKAENYLIHGVIIKAIQQFT